MNNGRKARIRLKVLVTKRYEVNITFDVHTSGKWIAMHFYVLRVDAIAVVTIANSLIVVVPAVDRCDRSWCEHLVELRSVMRV
jgi:hypothetical protein